MRSMFRIDNNKLVEDLAEKGWFTQQNICDSEFIQQCINEFQQQSLKEAGIGLQKTKHPEIRNDKIYWLERSHNNPIEDIYLQFFDEIKQTLNRNLYLGLKGEEIHYAQYSKGGFYKPHYDNFQGRNKRVITCITYLNNEWVPQNGGTLRLHLPQGIKEIEPRAGTFVAFMSEQILHEVSHSHRTRHSLTGWMLNSPNSLP